MLRLCWLVTDGICSKRLAPPFLPELLDRRDLRIAIGGAVQMVLGLIGLAVAVTPAGVWTPVLSGVLCGVVLLAGSLSVAVTAARSV